MKRLNSKKLVLKSEHLITLVHMGHDSTRHGSCDGGGTDGDGTCLYRIGSAMERL